jgi:hypothetical protein
VVGPFIYTHNLASPRFVLGITKFQLECLDDYFSGKNVCFRQTTADPCNRSQQPNRSFHGGGTSPGLSIREASLLSWHICRPARAAVSSRFADKPISSTKGRFFVIPLKTAHGVFNTPLNAVWTTKVAPAIIALLKARHFSRSVLKVARFSSPDEDKKDVFGPIVRMIPGSSSGWF